MKRYLSYLVIASVAITILRFQSVIEPRPLLAAPPEIAGGKTPEETASDETASDETASDETASDETASDETPQQWDVDSAPRPFEAVCWEDFLAASNQLTEKTARQWLEEIDGHPLNLTESSNIHGTAVTIQGLARLRAPWVDDSVLRWSFHSTQPFALHFYSPGQQAATDKTNAGERTTPSDDNNLQENGKASGVSLWFYRVGNRRSLVAYRITRRPGERLIIGDLEYTARDPGLALLTTDDQRDSHAFCGTYAVRYQDGSLVLTKGDAVLLTAPMPAPPAEVYLEGNSALLQELAMFRGGPAAIDQPRQRDVVLHGRLPSVLDWKEELSPGTSFHRHRNGSVELIAPPYAEPAWVSLPLVRRGLYEIILEVEDASPNAGIYLGDQTGKPLEGIGYFFDPQTGLTGFGLAKPNVAQSVPAMNVKTSPSPYAPRRQWLRLVASCGTLRCWTSGDGRHWGQPFAPLASASADYSHIALHLRTGSQQRRVVLHRLQVRQFDAITSLAPATIVEQAARLRLLNRLADQNDYEMWRQQVWDNLPREVDPTTWRCACAVAGLIEGPTPTLGKALLDELVQYSLSLPTPVDVKLRVIRAAVLLGQTASGDERRLAGHYQRLESQLLRDANPSDLEKVRRAKMTIPLWTNAHGVEPLNVAMGRSALLRLAQTTNANRGRADRVTRQLRFWNQSPQLSASWPGGQKSLEPLVNWTQVHASPDKPPEKSITIPLNQWRHPLAVLIDKGAYNFHAELQAAVEEQAFKDAAQSISSLTTMHADGLVSDKRDRHLFVSIPASVALTMKRHSGLQKSMVKEFGDLGSLQARWTQSRNDATAVRNTTVRFYGTPAASEAHRWIGDQLLSRGQFSQAVDHYQRALPHAAFDKKHDLRAQLRLAAAMLGKDVGEKVTRRVSYGSYKLSATEFELLVAEMITANSDEVDIDVDSAKSPLVPAHFDTRPFSEFAGGVPIAPDQTAGLWNSPSWLARETTLVSSHDALFATDRYRITSVDHTSGETNWTFSLSDTPASSNSWRYQSSSPAIVSERLYVRLMRAENQPELVCLNQLTGELIFSSKPAGAMASDPVFIGSRLFVFVVETHNAALGSYLRLVELDPTTGMISHRHPLIELRVPWNSQFTCAAVAVGDRICVTLPGGILCCNAAGDVLWVRQEPKLPSQLNTNGNEQWQQPPVVDGNRVYSAVEGNQGVNCVALDTGELLWRLPLPGMRKILGVSNNRLYVHGADAIVQADTSDGRLLWGHATQNVVSCLTPSNASQYLCYVCYRPLVGTEQVPVVVWLDLQTGRPIASELLLNLPAKTPLSGAIVARGNRLWLSTATLDEAGGIPAVRKILELAPAEARNNIGASYEADASIAPALRIGVDRVLPGWSIFSGMSDDKTGLHVELAGRSAVLSTKAHTQPTRLAARVDVPDSDKPFLYLNVSCGPLVPSRLNVRINGIVMLQHLLLPDPQDQWQRLAIDLSNFSGQTVSMTIVHGAPKGDAAYAYWSGIELSEASQE